MMMAVIPYVQVVVKWLTNIAQAIAKFFGFEIDTKAWDTSTSNIAGGIEDIGDSAAGATKELKKMLAPFDELNVIDFGDDKGSGSGGAGGIGGSLDIPLPEYDALAGLKDNINDVEQNLKKLLPLIASIGTGLLSLKVSSGFLKFLNKIGALKPVKFSFGLEILGLANFLADLVRFKEYLDDIIKNGASLKNVAGLISEFAGMLGDAFTIFGRVKIGGALKVIQGIGEIVSAISDIAKNGINWDNATTAITGLTNVAIGIGLFTKNLSVAAWATAIQGLTGVIEELHKNWDAITKGDWSGVDKVKLAISGLQLIGGFAVGVGAFVKVLKGAKVAQAVVPLQETTTATEAISGATGQLSPTLKTLAKNLGMGIAIIAEVAAAAIIFVGAIIVIGKELEQVALAWEPVIANGLKVSEAMVAGTGILVAIGIVTALFGQVGGVELIKNIALGTAILAEIGAASILFIAEIWAIGKLLEQVALAWQPVFDNGQNIIQSIAIGTGILIAIGAVAGLLGVATTATGGLLPLAIGLGTAMLLELGVAAGLFIVEIWAIGKGLQEIEVAWQPVIQNGDGIKSAIKKGTTLLVAIGGVTALLGVATVATGGLLPAAIGLGTKMLDMVTDAVIKFIESLTKVARQLHDKLSPNLARLNSKFPTLITNLNNYVEFMKIFATKSFEFTKASAVAGFAGIVDEIISWFAKDPIEKFANDVEKTYKQTTDLNARLQKANPELATALTLLTTYQNFLKKLDSITRSNNNIKLAGTMFIDMKEVGKNLVNGLVEGINSKMRDLNNIIDRIKKSFSTNDAWRTGYDFGQNIAWGVNRGIKDKLNSTIRARDTESWDVVKRYNIEAYATGGYPEQGQLFIANEAGPELIGNIGNQAAVANNDQIVEGIRQGVYSAVVQANSGNNKPTQTTIYIGNDKVYQGYGKYANNQNNKYGANVIKI